nr:beta-L-arabinofuranosidase domain-containing protein [Nakamurella flavida]
MPVTGAAALVPFPLSAVTLAPSIFTANRDRLLRFARDYPVDRMLVNFRANAGLDTRGAAPIGSWEEPTSQLRGHFTGHYLSMLAQAVASGETSLAATLTTAVDALGECQDALAVQGGSAGYLAAYPETQFDQLEVFVPYPTIWAPWYTCHKIMAGLLDAYDLTGNARALGIVSAMGRWAFTRLSRTTAAQRQRMWQMYIAGEYGGMNESLMRLYEITGDADFSTAAGFFDTEYLLQACAANQDILDGKHANQHIPQFLGYLKRYDATGRAPYVDAVRNMWEMVVPHRMYAHGGTGQGEIFRARDRIGASIVKDTNAETCAAYNMLKVSRELFLRDPDPKYMEYYERALFNQIAGSRRASDSGDDPLVTYMLPVGPGVRRGYGNLGTCCGGTGLENHTKYQDSIFFAGADGSTLYVNLYIGSTLTWAARSLTVALSTELPTAGTSTLTVTGSGPLDLRLRIPVWAQDAEVAVNGTAVPGPVTPGSYLSVSRDWTSGDTVAVTLPMRLRVERALDDPTLQTLAHGPIALVARSSQPSFRAVSLFSALTLSGSLETALRPTADAGFFRSADGTVWAPMYVGSDDPYHLYFRRSEPMVVFAGTDAGVVNPVRPDRTTLLDDIWARAPFTDRQQFVRTVTEVSATWAAEGLLSRRDRQAVLLGAARARLS